MTSNSLVFPCQDTLEYTDSCRSLDSAPIASSYRRTKEEEPIQWSCFEARASMPKDTGPTP